MTVASVVTEVVYAMTGSNLGPFDTVFPYEEPSDILVWVTPGSATWQLLTGEDYTLAAIGGSSLSNGGQVTLNDVLLPPGGSWGAGASVALIRQTSGTQPSAFGEADGFSPQTSEQALDHAVRQAQDVSSVAGATPRSAPGVGLASFAGQLAFVDGDGFIKPSGYTIGELLTAILGTVFVSAPDDATAAALGVPIKGVYLNGNVVQVRLA